MAGKQVSGDGLSAELAGMTKNQLYDIMSQMKTLIEQNKEQARDILIKNPLLTKALFQAQIMLGMVQPPKVIPNIQLAASQPLQQLAQPSQQPAQSAQQSNDKSVQLAPVPVSLQDLPGTSQGFTATKQQSSLSMIHSHHTSSLPSQTQQQAKGLLFPQGSSRSISQLPSLPTLPPAAFHSASLSNQPQMAAVSKQLQQSLQKTGISLIPLQPPLPPQPRPPSMQSMHNQMGLQMGPNLGFQSSHHPTQPMFHSGSSSRPQAGRGTALPLSQTNPQSQPSYKAAEMSNVPGNTMDVDRGSSSWTPGAPLLVPPGHTAQAGLPARPPPPLTPEMEKALLQQVMSLTPEQINHLPLAQRAQVLQLQHLLRS